MEDLNKIIVILLTLISIENPFIINHLFAAQDIDTLKNEPSEVLVRPNIEYKAEDLRDPFLYPPKKDAIKKDVIKQVSQEDTKTAPLPKLTIQGIIWGSDLPQAIINNKVVKKGDVIEGVRIIDINKDGIRVSFDNREYNLSSPAGVNLKSIKKSPKGGPYYEKK